MKAKGKRAKATGAELRSRLREVVSEYALPILRWLAATYGPDSIKQAWREFRLRADLPFTQNDPHTELFFSWLLHSWLPRPGSSPPTQQYLALKPTRLAPLLRQYLRACLSSPLAFYEVTAVGFRMRNLSTGVEQDISDEFAALSLKVGDIVFARIVSVRGIVCVDAISPYSFPPSLRPRRSLTRKTYFTLLERYLSARAPQIRNGDTDLMEPQTLYFVIDSAQAAFDQLASLAVGVAREELLSQARFSPRGELREVMFPWSRAAGNTILGSIRLRGRHLMVDVDSAERAEIFRAIIQRTPGARARYTTTRRRRS